MPETIHPSRVQFPTLDGYRAIAALAVLLFHVLADTGFHAQAGYLGEATFRLGNYGVTVFFVLSGFLLYRPYARADIEGHAPPAFRPYIITRLFRIVPAYWVALSAVILLDIAKPQTALDWISFYGFAQIYRAQSQLDGLGVAWTLNIEMAFYLTLPILAVLIRKIPMSPMRRQAAGLSALYLVAWAYRGWLAVADAPHRYTFLLPGYIDWFVVGMALALLSVMEHNEQRLPALIRLLAQRPWISILLAFELYWLLVQINLPTGFNLESGTHTLLRFPFAGLSAGLLMLPGVLGKDRRPGLGAAILCSRPMRSLGQISYGIYLWHLVVIRALDDWQGAGWFPESVAVVLPIVVITTLALASMSYSFVEMPAVDLGRRISGRRPERPVSEPQPTPEYSMSGEDQA